MKTKLKAVLMGLALVAAMGGWLWQRQNTVVLRKAIAGLQKDNDEAVAENARLQRMAGDRRETPPTESVRAEIEKTRQEVASLEAFQRRQASPPPLPPRSQHFTDNRDPEKGPVRVGDFRDAGQATPSAAFQTAIWALATENYAALPPLLEISPAGREKLRAMVARMDAAAQARYDPPEKIVGLLMARDLLDEEGYAIAGMSEPDASGQVKLSVLRVRNGRENKLEKKLPFRRGPTGWQLPITDKMIDTIPSFLESASMYVTPRGGER